MSCRAELVSTNQWSAPSKIASKSWRRWSTPILPFSNHFSLMAASFQWTPTLARAIASGEHSCAVLWLGGVKVSYVLWADFAELFVKHKRVQQTTLVIVDSPKEQGVGLNLERALNLLKDTGEVRSPRRHHGESPRTRPRNPLGQNNMSGKPLDQSSASVLSGQPLFQAQMGDMSGIATTTSAGGVCRDLSVFPRPVANRNHGIRQVPGPHLLLGYHNHIAFDCD